MSISVLVPTLLTNPACEEALESIVAAAELVPGSEVLVVANGPGPRRHPSVLDCPPIRLLESSAPGTAAARNVALDAARHPVVLFTDDDCLVPPTWCADLLDGLGRSGATAVAAPVDVLPMGPVTAFLNYQRFWDAAPLGGEAARYLVTANCALRLSETAVRFDEQIIAMEDLDFGYRFRDGGGEIAWLDTTPVTQLMTETVDQLSRRFLAWGRDFATLHVRGRTLAHGPYALAVYGDLCRGGTWAGRRFQELPDPAVRSVFASLDRIHVALSMAGFLEGLGEHVGHRFIEIDHHELMAGWRALIDDRVAELSTVDWADLGSDPARLRAPAGPETDLRREIGDLLTRYAPLTSTEPPAAAREVLERVPASLGEDMARTQRAALDLAAALPGADGDSASGLDYTIEWLQRSLRAAGVQFSMGMSLLESALAPAPTTVAPTTVAPTTVAVTAAGDRIRGGARGTGQR